MDATQQLRSFTVRLFVVSPFFLFASLIWISLLSDMSSNGNFGLHYKSLLAAYPILRAVTMLIMYSFSIMIIATFISILLAFNAIYQIRDHARWLKTALPILLAIITIVYSVALLIYTPPDGYIVLIFFVVLAALYTQLHRFSEYAHNLKDLRLIFLPASLASLAMTLIFVLVIVWLAFFWTDSNSLSQPWLNFSTLIFMLVSALVMGITTLLSTLELVRSFSVWRTKTD